MCERQFIFRLFRLTRVVGCRHQLKGRHEIGDVTKSVTTPDAHCTPHSPVDWRTLRMSEEEDSDEFGTVVHIRLNKSLGEADSVEEDDEDSVEDNDDSDDGDYVPPNYVQTTKQPQLRGSR
ncbi:hypothetical protein BC938DRAFT_482054 [Jimgerdemannia flammicorona]|uniref:Uncharacterized protein n=1 Tax=Jimgerdemannia flammicorona TaxID=994334 RepID=A0A433QEP4_9FUNG|nr:hypothetical protein BC938DRAFT_482054 [Jimgerdemannia flammicorona]